MTRRLRFFAPVAIVAVTLGSGPVAAQSGGGKSNPSGAQVGFEKKVQLSPQEEVTQAELILTRIDQASGAIRRQLDTARQGRDVVKSLCLSDKLSQVDVAGRTGRERQATLQSAAQRGDIELENHEFNILTVLRQRTEQLGAEANQCIGEEVAFVGQTVVTMTVDTNLPTVEETTTFPSVLPSIVTTPPTTVSATGM